MQDQDVTDGAIKTIKAANRLANSLGRELMNGLQIDEETAAALRNYCEVHEELNRTLDLVMDESDKGSIQ